MTGPDTPDLPNLTPPSESRQAALRLLIIPLLIYVAWCIEIFLLEGRPALFRAPDPAPLVFYTVVGCILIGIVAPVLLIRRSFGSGAVNMFQIGFRPFRRTLAACTVTVAFCYFVVLLVTPAGPARVAVSDAFLLYLPTGIAAVMICWVLIGTHLQALVRTGGAVVSIPTGVVITAILYGVVSLAHTPVAGQGSPMMPSMVLGIVTALFFFAVRDVYATVFVTTTGMALLFPLRFDPALMPGVIVSAFLAFFALLAVHGYFSQNYATVIVVPDH
jgi:hypothetical protein